jgi:uncharacterized protein YndB with AHSA1/START domain
MAPIVETIEIARTPEAVFAYFNQLERHIEWQPSILSISGVTEGPVGVGTRSTETRRGPFGAKLKITYEIVEHDAPHRIRFRGTTGPVRAIGTFTVDPADDASRSEVTLQLDFDGRGIGKLLAPLVRREAAKDVPQNYQLLKTLLENDV